MPRLVTLGKALLLALVLTAGAEIARTVVGSNFHTVVPGRCYRCAQPSAANLRTLLRKYGIRSVINLRGYEDEPWYQREHALAHTLGVRLIDLGMWAARPATEEELPRIVQAVDEATEPVLIHCVSGIDRSGMVAALFLLLRTDADVETALGQLSLCYGHNPWGKAACQDRILLAYQAWLAERGLTHRPERLRHWANVEYRQEPGEAWKGLK